MWWEGLIGGIAVGLSSAGLLLVTGRLTGISGFINTLALFQSSDMRFKIAWLAGLLALAAALAIPESSREMMYTLQKGASAPFMEGSELAYALGGYLVGFGTRFGSGCTSGHSVCGMSRVSPRSIVATAAFMATGFLTATAVNSPANGGGALAGAFNSDGQPLAATGNPMLKSDSALFLSNDPIPEVSMAVLAVSAVALGVVLVVWRSSHDLIDSVASFLAGAVFAAGLAVGGMTQRNKLLGFLTLDPRWDSQLVFVMGAAVLVVAAAYRLAYQIGEPLLASHPEGQGKRFCVPQSRTITVRLVLGGMVFGVGWALTGACPGPALMMAAAGKPMVLVLYLPAMVLGMWSNQWAQAHVQSLEDVVQAVLDEVALLAQGKLVPDKAKGSGEGEGKGVVNVVGGGAEDAPGNKGSPVAESEGYTKGQAKDALDSLNRQIGEGKRDGGSDCESCSSDELVACDECDAADKVQRGPSQVQVAMGQGGSGPRPAVAWESDSVAVAGAAAGHVDG